MKVLLIVLIIYTRNACNKHDVLKTHSLSRENTTITFSNSKKPYSATEEVGGEQINSTVINAMADDTYLIEVLAENDSLDFYVDGQFINVQIVDNNSHIRKVNAMANTKIILSFSAHPQSSLYKLNITKL